MNKLFLLLLVLLSACSFLVEGVGEQEQAVHTGVQVILADKPGGVWEPSWTHVPTTTAMPPINIGVILGDYTASNPNASYVYVPPGGPIHEELFQVAAPLQVTCNSIISIQSMTARWKLHTAGANETFVMSVYDPLTAEEGIIPCGNLSPWRPVGFQFDCGANKNPINGASWSKHDLGCNIITGPLEWEYSAAANGGIAFEAVQIVATVTTL